jgi:hypothetical protein
MRYATEKRNLAESIAEPRKIADGRPSIGRPFVFVHWPLVRYSA